MYFEFTQGMRIGCDVCTGEQCEWVEAHNKYRGQVDPPASQMSTMVCS